jgi:GrpB-like predicted nucleotidyltransferase (UPF0157 family)
MESRIISLAPPSPLWIAKFEVERGILEAILKGECAQVHHIGSTAIHGISAKPVVDILIEAESLDGIDARNEAMSQAGFRPKGENGISRRRYFQKESSGVRTVHVHAFQKGDIRIERHLAFRNGMNAHPDMAKEYERVKQKAMEMSEGISQRYQEIKGEFIEAKTRLFLKSGFGMQSRAL